MRILVITISIVIAVYLVIVGLILVYGISKKPTDYQIELQKDGTIFIHTDYGHDTILVTLDSLEEFIEADNL